MSRVVGGGRTDLAPSGYGRLTINRVAGRRARPFATRDANPLALSASRRAGGTARSRATKTIRNDRHGSLIDPATHGDYDPNRGNRRLATVTMWRRILRSTDGS